MGDERLKNLENDKDSITCSNKFKLNKMNGKAMLQLVKYSHRNPSLYKALLNELSFPINHIGTLLCFTHDFESTFGDYL